MVKQKKMREVNAEHITYIQLSTKVRKKESRENTIKTSVELIKVNVKAYTQKIGE